jgi:hypothetical protein
MYVEKNRWTQDKKTCNSGTTVVLPCAVLPVNYSDESSVVNDAPRWVLTMIGKTTLVAAKTGDLQTRGT